RGNRWVRRVPRRPAADVLRGDRPGDRSVDATADRADAGAQDVPAPRRARGRQVPGGPARAHRASRHEGKGRPRPVDLAPPGGSGMLTGMSEQEGPLAGVRVLELGSFIAGPFAGQLLGDYGAEVVKVEEPGGGDPMRGWGITIGGDSLWWPAIARNKKSVAIDL